MNIRKGLLLVPKDHDLQPTNIADAINKRSSQVIAEIKREMNISERTLPTKVIAHSNSSKSNTKIFRSILGDKPDDNAIRVVFSDVAIQDDTVQNFLDKNTLTVVAKENQHEARIKHIAVGTGCRIELPKDCAARMMEDVFIDIFMGRWYSDTPIFRGFLKSNPGLDVLFKRKSMYFKENLSSSWICRIEKNAGYAPLASLNTCVDGDIAGRAKATVCAWKDFSTSLTNMPVVTSHPFSDAGRAFDKLEAAPKIGGQLPAKRIRRKVKNLPDGKYAIIVLRTASTVNKSPKARNTIQSIFGKNAKLNSFRFVPLHAFGVNMEPVKLLQRQNMVSTLIIQVKNGLIKGPITLLEA